MYEACISWLPHQLLEARCSAAQLFAWAAAAQASLRLQPVLVQLDAALQRLPHGNEGRDVANRLARRLILQLCSDNPTLGSAATGGDAAAERAAAELRGQLGRQLGQVHLAGCRLANWVAQQGAAGSYLRSPVVLQLLLRGLCKTLLRRLHLDLDDEEEEEEEDAG